MKRPSAEIVTAVSAVLISLASLAFTWYQTVLTRQHNRLSVTPSLHVLPHVEGSTGKNGLYLYNAGLGPGRIKRVLVQVGDKTFGHQASDLWPNALEAGGMMPICFGTWWPPVGWTLKPGDEMPLIYLTKATGAEECFRELAKLVGGQGIKVEIHYESLYGEQGMVSASSKIESKSVEALYKALVQR